MNGHKQPLLIGTTTQQSGSVKYKSICRTLAILEAIACSHSTYSDQPNNNQAVSLNTYLVDGNFQSLEKCCQPDRK